MQTGEVKELQSLPHANLSQHLNSLYPSHNMQPCELIGVRSLLQANPDEYPPHLTTYCSDSFLNSQIHHPVHEFSTNTPSLSNKNSNSIEAEEHNLSINHERKLKRLISNRESARRSRMRKRKQLEELQIQVAQLQTLYHKLTEKFIHLLECNHQILQENAQLKEEVSFFQKIINDAEVPF